MEKYEGLQIELIQLEDGNGLITQSSDTETPDF